MASRSASRASERRCLALGTALKALERRYETTQALDMDPLCIPHTFEQPMDRELAAWIAAHLAYGRVAPMLKAIRRALAPLGPCPADWLRDTPPEAVRTELRHGLQGWVWRFHTAEDLVEWILAWRRLDAESSGGLEPHLLPTDDRSADTALSALVQRLRSELPPTHGTRFSLPDPLESAACKRWRMFLRWMVRTEWPDLGLWSRYPASELVIPLDTHVARIARLAGLSSRRTPDGAMAREITEALRAGDARDPLRFDFALSHLGILGDCPGKYQEPSCAACPLAALCGRPAP